MKEKENTLTNSLVAGGCAGFAVDVTLFPLDTIKTRLQSSQGFWKAGGFSGVYRGIGSAAVGSAPSSALFFGTYEYTKRLSKDHVQQDTALASLVHCLGASLGEVTACAVRVPTENIKQKLQAKMYKTSTECIKATMESAGIAGFFKGFWTTVFRDAPFSFIQFPIYEKLKLEWSKYLTQNNTSIQTPSSSSSSSSLSPSLVQLQPWQGAVCGSIAGAFSGGVTTPLDVVKTRLMLGADANGVPYTGMRETARRVYAEGGVSALYSGLTPRVIWITLGGLVYFGAYEHIKMWWRENMDEEES